MTIPVTKSIGQTVESTGTVAQVFAFVHFVFETREELERIIGAIHATLHVKDQDGNEMVLRKLDLSKCDIEI